jgi:hypothetical protein
MQAINHGMTPIYIYISCSMNASEFPDFGAFLPDLVGPHACTVFLRKRALLSQ